MAAPISALVAALDLGRQGYACFPCRVDKRPACPHGFKDAVRGDEDLRALWSEFPGEIVGVATGAASGIVVLDVDAKHAEAHEWYTAKRDRLQPTRTHRTRSGGLHLLYTDPGGVKCSASKIAKGIDTRGDGGYIVWWPAEGLPVLSGACAPAPWPVWLNEAIAPSTTAISQQAIAARAAADPSRRPAGSAAEVSVQARIAGLCRQVLAAPVGTHNTTFNWAVWTVCRMGLSASDEAKAIEALKEAARQIGHPEHRIASTVRSATGGAR